MVPALATLAPADGGGVIYFTDGTCHELGGSENPSTNNRMELQAAIAVLDFLQDQTPASPVPLYTDSEYVKNGITQWLAGWKRKGWKTAKGKPVLNQDLWQKLDDVNVPWVQWKYVQAHVGILGNERCDQIARSFALQQAPSLQQVTHHE